jgi:hypothetical protein
MVTETRTKSAAEETADQADPVFKAFTDIEWGENNLVSPDAPQYVQDALTKARKARELAHAAFLDLANAVETAREQSAGQ